MRFSGLGTLAALAVVLAVSTGCAERTKQEPQAPAAQQVQPAQQTEVMPQGAQERRPVMSEQDVIQTSAGDLTITFVGHASLMFSFSGKVIHVDPVSREGDYSQMPAADIILITHEHGDHLDPQAIAKVRKDDTVVILTEKCAASLKGGVVMRNGDERTVKGLEIQAVPAYNIEHMRGPGMPFHPKGDGNGYIITFGDKRVYVAGDTENTPEMKALRDIDVAFLPMNLPYTMTPEMVADAARAFRPAILYPYHYGNTDTSKLTRLLAGEPGIEVRIRPLQ
jgi:L-ascorbate metabolism protein UlaG (beta-lactamase superfamily)